MSSVPTNDEICLRMKDGKILIAKRGKPFFPEPLDKNVIIVKPGDEGFLIGPYPQHNTIIMPLNQYHKMMLELKRNCPNAKTWRVAALVFIGMFIVMMCIYLQQTIFSRDIFRYVAQTWEKKVIKQK